MSVKARMIVNSVEDFGPSRKVSMHAVYSSDPNDPNYSYSQATPSARVELMITNPAAFEQFQPQKTYTLTFEADGE
jgi:hypothetical protein